MERSRGLPVQYDPYNNLFERPGSEAFARLFNAEEYFMVPPSYLNNEVKKALRKTAIEIIESHSSTSSNFDALIPYTAMTYFDRFLSRSDIFPLVTESFGGRNPRLFVTCCLTIAWKLRNKSFNLSIFLRERGLAYSTRDVLRMELEICRGLEWRMRTLTPFCFVDFYIPVLRRTPNLPSPCNSVRYLIVRSQCDIAFTEFRPSVIAVSAMLIVSSKMFPDDRHKVFELKITTDVEPLRLLKDMILKCNKQLTPLYRNPPVRKPKDIAIQINQLPAPGTSRQTNPAEPKAPALPRRSAPIYIPGKEPPPDPPEPREMSEGLRRACIPLGADVETQPGTGPTHRPGKEPATIDIKPASDELKEPVTNEIQPQSSEDGEELMDFELGWKELLEAGERRDGPGRAWFIWTYIVGGLTYCWIKLATTYEDVKNKAAGGQCNIL